MKILVLSDIHANIWAVEAILKAEKEFDLLIFAGDIVDYGTAPSEAIEWLRQVPCKCAVQGNHDAHAVRVRETEDYDHMPPERYKWIHYDLQRMSSEQTEYLRRLPVYDTVEADGWAYLTAHSYNGSYQMIESICQFEGFWRSHTPERLWDAPSRRIIFGHTHRQGRHILAEGAEWLNPGSVSYRRPDDPDKTAHYAVIEQGRVFLKRIPYERSIQYQEALRVYREEGMMETEVQDFLFFFGDAPTSRSPIPKIDQ